MASNPLESHLSGNLTVKLKTAASTLKQFAAMREETSLPYLAELTVLEGKLISQQKTSSFKQFLHLLFSQKAREKIKTQTYQVQDTVLHAIEVIKNHHLLLEKFQSGSPEEQQLAQTTLEAVKHYNTSIAGKEKTLGWKIKLSRLFYEKNGLFFSEELQLPIELPSSAHLPHYQPLQASWVQKTIPLPAHTDPLFQQEADLIRMKANTLLKQMDFPLGSEADTIKFLRQAKIETSLDPVSERSTLNLLIEVLPGSLVQVTGSFQRHRQTASPQSTPIADSFQMTALSSQTGFPFPSQHTGWALADVLIPTYPHRLWELPLIKEILERKEDICQALCPEGSLLERAKRQYEQKKTLVNQDPCQWLLLHEQLSQAFLKASGYDLDLIPSVLNPFFEWLRKENNPFDSLGKVYQILNQCALSAVFTKIHEEWIEKGLGDQIQTDPLYRQEQAKKILRAEAEKQFIELADHPAKKYLCCFGQILSKAGEAIMLQHLSEMLQCTPPMLNDFERKLQLLTYKQLRRFMNELDERPLSLMMDALQEDIQVLDRDLDDSGIDIEIVEELETYYNSRFYETWQRS